MLGKDCELKWAQPVETGEEKNRDDRPTSRMLSFIYTALSQQLQHSAERNLEHKLKKNTTEHRTHQKKSLCVTYCGMSLRLCEKGFTKGSFFC